MNVALHPRPESCNILSLCTGGGGLDLGLELAMPGARTVCMVEREAFAVAHLVAAMQQGLLAPAPVWSDVRTFQGRGWRGLVDGIIGGIPCQPHSNAGKRKGRDDERDLWAPARRIIVQSRCWFALIENVGGMLTSGGAERVWRDLRRLGFAGLALTWRQDCSRRLKLARRTSASAGSASQWPTPRSSESENRTTQNAPSHGKTHGKTLAGESCDVSSSNWPTPTARDWKDTGNMENVPENALLGRVVMNWTTPRATDGEKGSPNQSFGAGGIPLAAQASQWMTPRVSETGAYQYNKGNKDNPVLTLQGQSQAMTLRSILPDRPISTVGEESSHIRRTLNPLFVEWLMGWPRDWTLLALMPPASNACACSATALSAWKRRMRSELYALGLPGAAQPAQLGLFV